MRADRVHRVNLHFGDRLFWHLPATNFRGRFDDWRAFIAKLLVDRGITHLVLHGDRRPYHIVAAEEARARGIEVMATDLGYVRPDWITLERDGMSTYSRFPRDPETIRALAPLFPIPDLPPRFHTPFWLISVLDIFYNIGLVFGRPLYPHYRYHGIAHPFAEYFGWICSRAKQLARRPATMRLQERLRTAPGSYFIFPLQLPTDFQIRAHSRFGDAREALCEVIASFAKSATRRKLVIVVHPLDNGLIDWCGLVRGLARRYRAGDRVVAFAGGIPREILCHAAGMVTINSTISTTALGSGVPVKVLGNAVFDIPGLTSQQTLSTFWDAPEPPDQALTADLLRALIGTTQIKGGYYTRAAQQEAIAGFVDRLEGGLYELPPLSPVEVAARGEGIKSKHKEDISPPKIAEFLIYAVVPNRNRDAVLGDLEEVWNSAIAKFGVRAAETIYWLDVIRALRPFIRAGLREIARISGLVAIAERIWHFLGDWLGRS